MSDYLQRRFTREGAEVWFYVGYVAGYRPGAIHPPQVCFPNTGFDLEAEQVVTLDVPGLDGPVPLHEGVWANPSGERLYSLTTFRYRGKFEQEVWRLKADRLLGIPFFAKIMLFGLVSEGLDDTRESYRAVLARLLPSLLGHFPEASPP